jgi:hypothetical protein
VAENGVLHALNIFASSICLHKSRSQYLLCVLLNVVILPILVYVDSLLYI